MRFIRYLSIYLLSIALFSCEQENRLGDIPVSFHLVSESETRGNEIEAFSDGDAVGVYVLDLAASSSLQSSGNFVDNKKYAWNSEKKAFVAANNSELVYNSPDRTLAFYVYFPYYDNISDATQLRHVIAGLDKDDDFLFAVNSTSGGAQHIPISFNHLLSKVNVKYTSTENRDKALMSVSTYTNMDINLATGVVTTIAAGGRADISLERVDAADYAGFVGVVAPQTYLQGEKFGTLTYTGVGSYPFSFAQNRTFASGEENEVFFMSRQPAYVFSVSPGSMSVPPKTSDSYSYAIESTKSQAVNGVNLPGTTIPQDYVLSDKPEWVTVSGTAVSFSENRSSARSGVVTFTQAESGYTTAINVSQSEGVVTYDYPFTFSDGTTNKTWTGVAATGSSSSYTITSNKQKFINGTLESTDVMTYSGSSNVEWISVSGSTLTVSENRTTSARSGVVTFTQSESGKTITVDVSQTPGVITYDYTFTFSDGSTNKSWSSVSPLGGTESYTITSTRKTLINGVLDATNAMTYAGSANIAWAAVSGTSIIVSENTGSARSGVVTFTQAESGNTITVNVSQSASVTTYGYVFTFSDGTTNKTWSGVAATGGSSSYTITSNKLTYVNSTLTATNAMTYTGSANVGWISVTGTTLTVSENTGSARSGVVTFTQAESGNTITVNVSQSAGVTTYSYEFTFSDGSTSKPLTGVPASGSTTSYTITSNKKAYINGTLDATTLIGYSGSANVGWITVSGSNVIVSGNTGSARSGVVTFTQAESGNTITVNVSQSAGVTTYDYEFTFSDGSTSKSWTNVVATGGNTSYAITSNKLTYVNSILTATNAMTYTGSANVGWISVTGTTLTVSENTGSARSGVVTFTQAESGNTIVVNVSQSGGVTTYANYVFTFSDGTTSKSWTNVVAGGDTSSYTITSTREKLINGVLDVVESVTYSGSSTMAWITFSGSSVIVGENPNTTLRGGVATFTQAESGKTITVTITQQKKNAVDIE